MSRILWDSCVIIDFLEQTPGGYETLKSIVDAARAGDLQLVVSAFARAEVFKMDESNPLSADEGQLIKKFFSSEWLHMRNVDRFIADAASEIARQHGIRPPDAVHVATALRFQCDALQTYDGTGPRKRRHQLLKHDGKIGSPPLKIEEPQLRGQKGLFENDNAES